MVYLAVNKDGSEVVSNTRIKRFKDYWVDEFFEHEFDTIDVVFLPKGSIKKLIGRELTWEDNPVEFTEKNLDTESFNEKTCCTAEKLQKESINNLWHNVSEEPKKEVTILVDMRNRGTNTVSWYLDHSGDVLRTFTSWSVYTNYFGVTHWLYLSDILPKKDVKNLLK